MIGSPPVRARRPAVLDDLIMVVRQLRYEQLNFWRNRFAALMTVVFSVVFMLFTVASTGHSARLAALGGVRALQYFVPGFAAYGVMSACYSNLGISLVVRREVGLLKRLRLSPIPTWILFSAILANAAVVSVLQVAVLLVIGRFGFGLVLPHQWLALVLAVVIGVICFSALGVGISAVVPSQESAGPIISLSFFVLLFLSGLWFPLAKGSALAKIADYFPIHHLILAFWRPFDPLPGASPWSWHDLLVVGIWGAAASIVAVRRFRWEPHRR